jgi:hypothetical protein
MYPFHSVVETTSTKTIALHPLFSWHTTNEGRRDFDILFPIFSDSSRPQKYKSLNYRSTYLFPLFFQRRETREASERFDQMILPLWFQGKQGNRGRYIILAPIIWYSYNARLAAPLFPPREQTFAAIFPLVGDFRGYWNRDRISFFLWPLYVYSSQGKGTEFNEIRSFIWPFFGLYGGHKISGFRIWPLYAYTKKQGEYTRVFWLWPLGHRRTGRISKTDARQQDVTMFIPFYTKFRRENLKLDFVMPFYGKLEVGDRVSVGYGAAIYNRDFNYREGTVEDRYLWFLIRNKRRLKDAEGEEVAPERDPSTGGGFFPFYLKSTTSKRVRKVILWPISFYKLNIYQDYRYERRYLIPFYADQRRLQDNGDSATSKFIFPFFRVRKSLKGVEQTNVLHLFFYNDVDMIDRLYAPLWTYWESKQNVETGERVVRLFKRFSTYERHSNGSVKRVFNGIVLRFMSNRDTITGQKSGYTSVLFGIFQKKATGTEGVTRFLGIPVHRWKQKATTTGN